MDTRSPLFFFSVLFLSLSLNTRLSCGASTIFAGESISGNKTIISEGKENFELGFFRPGNKSQNYYIGIWFRKISGQTVVWVANRDKPLSDEYSSELKLLEDGNLVLFNESKIPIWSTNLISTTSNSTQAVLLESGNLVLRDGSNDSNSSAFIWESFDHLTDTWLPGGKLGFNKNTNKTQVLTSWRNLEDPAPGIFSLNVDPGEIFVMRNGSERYWSSGTWNGQTFSSVPEFRSSSKYKFIYASNKDGCFFYIAYNVSGISRFLMDVSGQIKQLMWLEGEWLSIWAQPIQQCRVHSLCGAFGTCTQEARPFCGCLRGFHPRFVSDCLYLNDWSGGCERGAPVKCVNNSSVNGEKDGFLRMPNMRLPINPQSLAIGSAEACKLACLNNCSCTAYAYSNDGCSVWDGDLINLQQLSDGDSGREDLYLKLAASELRNSGGQIKGSVNVALVGAIAGVVALLGLALVLFWRWRRRRFVGPSEAVEGSLVPFGYRNLQIATRNFSEKLGGGGFGSVFKVSLPDSTVIAVKKLEGLRQGEKQFRSEVSTIRTIQHVNLVRLRGFCSEGANRLLVYDYMPKGSLDFHLFHEREDPWILDWKTRYQIALGTARGLAYLHEKCRDCIIHCNIKPENILLDAEFCPKVADFGLAKLVGREFSRVLTTMRGTIGYLAPEWISGVAITAKADVYSYGMMLFEIISGRRNTRQSEDGKVGFFPSWAASKITNGGDILGLLDHRLEGNANAEELTRACRVACLCIQDDEAHRPWMEQVIQILEGVLEINPPPIPRSLQVLVENQEQIVFFYESPSSRSSRTQTNTSTTSSQAESTERSTSSISRRC